MIEDLRLDPFQERAMEAIDAGQSVVVSAPTGAGKTLIAEHAVGHALAGGQKAFYTTPIKALSNQKFRDLRALHEPDQVGLLTGDSVINPDASAVVMTTEVLRNMIYAGAPRLADLSYVVLDEVHYLQDRYRGPVWEEVIVHLPSSVRLVCLSATVSNADELVAWITSVRGPTELIVETARPVTLEHLYMVGDRTSQQAHLLPVLVDGKPNRQGHRFDTQGVARKGRGRRPRRRWTTPRRVDVVERLGTERLRPAIFFIFSRAGCEDAVRACRDAGLDLTDRTQKQQIDEIIADRTASLPDGDLAALSYDQWRADLRRGYAAHHAGQVPAFKEAVEEAFAAGLLSVVFATETLALGINMPARSVVIENLSKFTGEDHELLTPAQYTQLTGRAGRRGIDDAGHALVLWSPFVDFETVSDRATSRAFRLTSAFVPTYNMAANLVRNHDREAAVQLLNLSFAQFQTDREIVARERRLDELRSSLTDARRRTGGPGDLDEFAELRARADSLAGDGDEDIAGSLDRLRPGDLLMIDDEKAAVISVAYRRNATKLRYLTSKGVVVERTADELVHAPRRRGSITLPEPYAPNNEGFLRETAQRLRGARLAREPRPRPRDPASAAIIEAAEAHPCHDDPHIDQRLGAQREVRRLERELARAERTIARRSTSLADHFGRILDLLDLRGYVDDWALTDRGRRLAGLYHECDLLVADALDTGVFDGLTPEELAAVASFFTYEHRSSTPAPAPHFPTPRVRHRHDEVGHRARLLEQDEQQFELPITRAPDPGFCEVAYRWAGGDRYDRLPRAELAPGDFVRNIKNLIDLLRQIGRLEPELADPAGRAIDAMRRDVVAAALPGAGS